MKLSTAQQLAITTTTGAPVKARPNTLAALVRLGLAEARTEHSSTGRAVGRHYLTEAGRAVGNDAPPRTSSASSAARSPPHGPRPACGSQRRSEPAPSPAGATSPPTTRTASCSGWAAAPRVTTT